MIQLRFNESLMRSSDSLQDCLSSIEELKRTGMKFIDCGIGETSHGLLPDMIVAGNKALKGNCFGYAKPVFGLESLRVAIAEQLTNEVKKPISEKNVIVTPGAGLGLDLIYRALLSQGDEVIVFDPFYIPFVTYAKAYGGVPIIIDSYDTDFLPDPVMVVEKITSRTKIIVINSPNNPTGRVFPKEIVKELALIARKRNITIISDETYHFFDYEKCFSSPYQFYPEGTLIVRSFSKQYSMMGYKVGYIAGFDAFIKKIKKIMTPCWSAPLVSSYIAQAALKTDQPVTILRHYLTMRNKLFEILNELRLAKNKPEGSIYFFCPSPNNDSRKFSLQLINEGLIVLPGYSLRNSHFRISYGCLENINIERVGALLKETISHV